MKIFDTGTSFLLFLRSLAGREERGSLIRVSAGVGRVLVSLNSTSMKILRALGLGLTIIMLKFLVPRVFAGFENTLVAFFDTLSMIFGHTQDAMTATSIFAPLPEH